MKAKLILTNHLNNMHLVGRILQNNRHPPLPIGLMSSGLLGNYYLSEFDNSVIEHLNPAYYGRYVDDIMFVFPNMTVESKAISTVNNFLDRYFVKRNLLKLVDYPPRDFDIPFDREEYSKNQIFSKEEYQALLANKVQFNIANKQDMIIQSEKVILHHFSHKESKAALNKFKKRLEDQRSEFRFLPDEDKLTSEFDEEAFSLQYNDSINKFRSIQELNEDKYGASKFLAQKIFARNYGDEEIDVETDNQILTFFKGFVGLSFYSLWEKVVTYFIITNNPKNIIKFKRQIFRSINNIHYDELDHDIDKKIVTEKLKDDLQKFLITSISVPLALNPSVKFETINLEEKKIFEECRERAHEIRKSNMFRQALVHVPGANYTIYTTIHGWKSNLLEFDEEIAQKSSKEYQDLMTSFRSNETDVQNDDINDHLTNIENQDQFLQTIPSLLSLDQRLAILSPRYVYFHEINIKKIYETVIIIDEDVKWSKNRELGTDSVSLQSKNTKKEPLFDLINSIPDHAFDEYWNINYLWRLSPTPKSSLKKRYFEITKKEHCEGTVENYVDIKGEDKNKVVDKRVAIANVKVEHSNIVRSINQKPNVSRYRRKELFNLLNQADKQKCDLLVLPEVSVPFSWIKLLAYRAHKRNVAIIAGLEHWINQSNFAFNFMLTILPIKLDDYTTSIIKIRLKNHYAHDEKELLKGHRLLIPRDTIKNYPKSYDLFHWRNTYFSIYNCFELGDINDRGLFKSKVDFIVAAEFNKDTNYFSDIAGSWVRDIHCYFIQVNTSQYGDSRLIQPAKSYAKDLIQIKGGLNSAILVGELKIEKLREFQLVEYNLQKEDINDNNNVLKPTPPDFNRNNVKIRIGNKSFK